MDPIVSPQIIPTTFRFTEQTDYEKGFSVVFEEKIKPIVRELETVRVQKMEDIKKNKPKANLILGGGIILGIAFTYLTRNLAALIFFGAISAVIRFGMISNPKREFATKFKEKILPEILKFFGDFKYQGIADLSQNLIKESQLFNYFNRSTFQDTITGTYRNRALEFSETHLSLRGNKSSSTIFDGKIIVMELNKTLMGKTVVKRDNQKGLWSSLTGKSGSLKKVAIQDPQFENIFEVYSSDENEAQSLLTGDVVVKLLRLEELYKGAGIRCGFLQNKIIIAIGHSREEKEYNLFEFGAIDESLEDNIHKFMAQFHAILEVVDTLNPEKKL